MIADFSIRKLQIWEMPKLLKLKAQNDYKAPSETRAHQESLAHALLKALWYGKRMVTFVAIRKGDFLGYITLVFGKQSKFKGNAYIPSVAVTSESRGQGIGTALLRRAEEYAVANKARRLELEVFKRNLGAIKLYESLGYETEGVKRRAVENGSQYDDLVFMAKLLN